MFHIVGFLKIEYYTSFPEVSNIFEKNCPRSNIVNSRQGTLTKCVRLDSTVR